jgi:metal-responsive CopG/Arc/MetJ family transcriptional regulator
MTKNKNKGRAPGQTAIAISMPEEMAKKIETYCEENDLKKSQYIRMLIREDQEKYKTRNGK